MLIKSAITKNIKDTLEIKQIKDIIGVRRSGKTTILYQIIKFLESKNIKPKNIVLLNFDDTELNAAPFDEIIKSIEKIDDKLALVFMSILYGLYTLFSGDIEKGEKILNRAYDLAVDFGSKLFIALATMRLGVLESFKLEYRKSLEFYFKSIELMEEAG